MKKVILFTTLMMFVIIGSAHKIEAKLIGESYDGKTVKLMWFLKKWDKSLIGFNIKRKTQDNTWVTINKETIVPEISLDKDLQMVENSTIELLRLKNKLKDLLDNGKLKTSDPKSFCSYLLSNNDSLKAMTRSFGQDFDFALFSGFGLVDRNMNNDTVQYGLFLVRNNEEEKFASSTFNWIKAEKATLNPTIKISSFNSDAGTKLYWSLPLEAIKKIHAKGFNVYKKQLNGWVKMNEKPIVAFDNVQNGYTYLDKNVLSGNVTYAITIATMLNNEGDKNEYLVKNKTYGLNDMAVNN